MHNAVYIHTYMQSVIQLARMEEHAMEILKTLVIVFVPILQQESIVSIQVYH